MSILLLITAAIVAVSANENFSDCATKLSTLEHALYETGNNVLELNNVFYPPSTRPSRFIKVTYSFIDKQNEDYSCNVTYIWAIGGFLFFQPPTVFKFNSLYFNYPNNHLTNLDLQLPIDCVTLINRADGECSCANDENDDRMLEILTKQVKNN